MTTLISGLLQFDVWEALDEETMELASTSEFWSQIQYETDRFDMMTPSSFSNFLEEQESDWRIPESEETHKKENVVHHDCMWAGSCRDSLPTNTFVKSEYISASPGQSLLKREISPTRPETPPSLDGDEPPQFRHTVDVAGTALRLLRTSAAVAADHSYTLARQNLDNLGVQTPSDSCESVDDAKSRISESEEEEIDVVSLSTTHQPLEGHTYGRIESLPRAPSAQERRSIQRTISTAMAPRPAARKRLVPPPAVSGAPRRRRGPGRRGRRSHTDTESDGDAPELERRSLHNDMERMRRIGLKNLFDELKLQVPATRDKERAPKVVILREAAALCRKLRQEDIERDQLMKQQLKLRAKLKKLRAGVAARYRY